MMSFKAVFELSSFLISGIVFYFYGHLIFSQKYKPYITLPVILAVHTAEFFLIHRFFSVLLYVIIIFTVDFLLFFLLFRCNIKSAVFHSAILSAILFASESIVDFIINILPGQTSRERIFAVYFFNITVSTLIYILTVTVTAIILSRKRKKQKPEKNSCFWFLFIIPLSSSLTLILINCLTFYLNMTRELKILCALTAGLLLFSCTAIFFIYERAVKNAEELLCMQAAENNARLNMEYLNLLEKNNREQKIFIHDIKNHIEQISLLTDDPRITSYIEKLYGNIKKFSANAYTGNKTLDVLLGKFLSLCDEKSIIFSMKTLTANFSDIDPADLCTIITNIMDNAVESAEKSENKNIELNIYSKNNFEIIKLYNSCSRKPETENNELLTTKTNKNLHGIGIKSVIKVLKKYDGIYSWSYNGEKQIFETTVIIPKQKT